MNNSNGTSFLRWMIVLALVTLIGTVAALCISSDGHTQTTAVGHTTRTSQMTSDSSTRSALDQTIEGVEGTPVQPHPSDTTPKLFEDKVFNDSSDMFAWVTVADNDGIIFRIDPDTGETYPASVNWERVCKMANAVDRPMEAVFRAMALQAGHRCSK